MTTSHQLYSDIEISSDVTTATGHRQIQLLLNKCLQHIEAAKVHISNKDMKQKHYSIKKAIDIITYLRTCLNLDHVEAVDLSRLLDSIYEFIGRSLLYATLNDDIEYLNYAYTALFNIKSGWDGIG